MLIRRIAGMTALLVVLAALGNAQEGKPVPKSDSIPANKADLPRVKADKKGNVVKIEGKTQAVSTPVVKAKQDTVITESGLKYVDTHLGTGKIAAMGTMAKMHYTGWHANKGVRGTKYDSSVDRKAPLAVLLGRGMLVKGWEEGMVGMKVGGKRTLIIKPELGYGANGFRDVVPPNTTLILDVELLDVTEPQKAH